MSDSPIRGGPRDPVAEWFDRAKDAEAECDGLRAAIDVYVEIGKSNAARIAELTALAERRLAVIVKLIEHTEDCYNYAIAFNGDRRPQEAAAIMADLTAARAEVEAGESK